MQATGCQGMAAGARGPGPDWHGGAGALWCHNAWPGAGTWADVAQGGRSICRAASGSLANAAGTARHGRHVEWDAGMVPMQTMGGRGMCHSTGHMLNSPTCPIGVACGEDIMDALSIASLGSQEEDTSMSQMSTGR